MTVKVLMREMRLKKLAAAQVGTILTCRRPELFDAAVYSGLEPRAKLMLKELTDLAATAPEGDFERAAAELADAVEKTLFPLAREHLPEELVMLIERLGPPQFLGTCRHLQGVEAVQ